MPIAENNPARRLDTSQPLSFAPIICEDEVPSALRYHLTLCISFGPAGLVILSSRSPFLSLRGQIQFSKAALKPASVHLELLGSVNQQSSVYSEIKDVELRRI